MAARKPLIAGNWKMYGRRANLGELEVLWRSISPVAAHVDALICPPAPYVQNAAWSARETGILIGAQDCGTESEDAARTGDVSAAMLADVGARFVIVGHSERRALFGETDAVVRRKAQAAQRAGLTAIVCVGETRLERDSGQAGDVVVRQVRDSIPDDAESLVIAYEPVWAIGGDRTPTPAEIDEIHHIIRGTLAQRFASGASDIRILYGGSVGPKNAAEVFAVGGVDGALVGRASLKAADFAAIILAHPAAK